MTEIKKNIILDKSIQFSLKIMKYVEIIGALKRYVILNQLLKSDTSIGANIHETKNAESNADVIHKFKISAKEMNENFYGLTSSKQSELSRLRTII